MWKDKLKNASLTQFWANVQSMEPSLSDLCKPAATALLPFPTTYLCESGFSTLTMIKTKYRNRLQPEDDIRCALATIIPEFDKLVKQVQGQGSHWVCFEWKTVLAFFRWYRIKFSYFVKYSACLVFLLVCASHCLDFDTLRQEVFLLDRNQKPIFY